MDWAYAYGCRDRTESSDSIRRTERWRESYFFIFSGSTRTPPIRNFQFSIRTLTRPKLRRISLEQQINQCLHMRLHWKCAKVAARMLHSRTLFFFTFAVHPLPLCSPCIHITTSPKAPWWFELSVEEKLDGKPKELDMKIVRSLFCQCQHSVSQRKEKGILNAQASSFHVGFSKDFGFLALPCNLTSDSLIGLQK